MTYGRRNNWEIKESLELAKIAGVPASAIGLGAEHFVQGRELFGDDNTVHGRKEGSGALGESSMPPMHTSTAPPENEIHGICPPHRSMSEWTLCIKQACENDADANIEFESKGTLCYAVWGESFRDEFSHLETGPTDASLWQFAWTDPCEDFWELRITAEKKLMLAIVGGRTNGNFPTARVLLRLTHIDANGREAQSAHAIRFNSRDGTCKEIEEWLSPYRNHNGR